jgi:hypothetical protein
MGNPQIGIAIAIGIAIEKTCAGSETIDSDSECDPDSDYSCPSNQTFNRERPSSMETRGS